MGKERKSKVLSVMEAVDQLSNMAEIDLKTVHEEEFETSGEINWRDPRQALRNEPLIGETFSTLHKYLQNVVKTDSESLKDPQVVKGIQAIMLLATEAVAKMDKYAALYPEEYKPISHLKVYQDLQKYYLQQILHQMPPPKEGEEAWESEIKGALQSSEKGLRDLEGVRKDHNYELFFIRDESGRPYFSRTLLRHIRLVGNFDELVIHTEGEDPLLRIRELLDRELQEGATEIVKQITPYLDEFYQEAMKLKERSFVSDLNMAIMALRMACNPQNLIENQSLKTCLEYFADFHLFLRASMQASGYLKRLHAKERDPFSHILLTLTHALSCYFFHRIEPRKETVALIHSMIERGKKLLPPGTEKSQGEFASLREADEALRYLLHHFPNGPIMRTLDAFREEEENQGFDPLTQSNFPTRLYDFQTEGFHVSAIRLPSPVKQMKINEAKVVEEFEGLLHFYQSELKPDRHLLVNLQDRTVQGSYARCKALEDLASNREFQGAFTLLGLPTEGDFYRQDREYETVSGLPVFLEQFTSFLFSGKEGGCILPFKEHLEVFIPQAFEAAASALFPGKASLKKRERHAFIDLGYLLIALKVIQLSSCDSISFTCKDGVDAGPLMGSLFFVLLRRLSGESSLTAQEKDHLLWMLYSPALIVRERPVDQEKLSRAFNAMELLFSADLKEAILPYFRGLSLDFRISLT